ncbi:MAG TPA: glycoside hydrolase family 15 protein [Verrucomicrobiae bacterium]|jgi:GH15 family glucan-1,4-alpha-glucosidase|nr:glycoside hydrolase family 15 protein [Verrucomicrobiae bacterium]
MSYQPIENHGVIGDLTTAALISMEASIDFMCFPNFDSPTIFAALLDDKNGGSFDIAPVSGEFKHRQRYLPDTNILLTRFLGEDGIAAISDFMAMQHLGHRHNLVRRVKVVRGEIRFRVVCAPKFNYGRTAHTIEKKPHEIIFVPRDKALPAVRLRSSVPLKTRDGAAVAEFKLRAGQTASFVLEEADGESPSANPDYISEAFKETMNYWLGWVAHSKYRGRWREMVNRSALTLKLLTSEPNGSIVAAPTFGLPETIGGVRNWDYRYTWIRDASFTLYALMRLGYTEEARAFMQWMEKRCRELKPGKPLQVMYRLDGRCELPESILKNFEGYRQSRPVRIGNGASHQLQLDIYGELMDSVLIYEKHGEPISYDFWAHIVTLVEWVCKNWKRPDDGIWEVRGGAHQFLYSRAMCWVAIDRAMKLAIRRSFPAPLVRWHRIRDDIYKNIYQKFWNPKLQSFVQYQGASTVDAASLLLPLVKFVSPTDPRWKSTLKAIEKHLVEDSLVYRYRPEKAASDGLRGHEGTFSTCSFWYVECLARAGDLKQARFIFEKALGYANHLGLYAEQLGSCGEHLGNFPQALSHIALISAAWNLDERLSADE